MTAALQRFLVAYARSLAPYRAVAFSGRDQSRGRRPEV
jgi:hypothetical protein